jgi:hypothetical protein
MGMPLILSPSEFMLLFPPQDEIPEGFEWNWGVTCSAGLVRAFLSKPLQFVFRHLQFGR